MKPGDITSDSSIGGGGDPSRSWPKDKRLRQAQAKKQGPPYLFVMDGDHPNLIEDAELAIHLTRRRGASATMRLMAFQNYRQVQKQQVFHLLP